MTKESTQTIYSGLDSTFWTKRKCFKCQDFFTLPDYQAHNYQLIFLKVLKITNSNLAVQVQLTHKSCYSGCTSYRQEIFKTPQKL